MRRYTFKFAAAGGSGPAVHIDACEDDDAARRRALELFGLWPMAVKVDVTRGEHHFQLLRPHA